MPQAIATLSGTSRSAAPVIACSVSAADLVRLVGHHVEEHLVVDLEDQVGGEAAALEPFVEADQRDLEQVGGETLDAGVHRLALGRLAQLVVGRGEIGQRTTPAERGHRVPGGACLGDRAGPCTRAPRGTQRSRR